MAQEKQNGGRRGGGGKRAEQAELKEKKGLRVGVT